MEMEMNMLVMKVALSASIVLAAFIIVENSYARPLRCDRSNTRALATSMA
jgi:hypothetical protein